MPSMPRFMGKGTKIAYKLLGTPSNMKPRSKYDRYLDRKLLYEETMRVR